VEDIIILWSFKYLDDDQKNNIQIFLNGSPVKCAVTYNDKSKKDIEDSTVVCVIDHKLNNISAYKSYTFDIILGEKNVINIKLNVLEYGSLPAYDKDNKKSRVHLMGYDNKEKQWGRVNTIKKGEINTFPVVILNVDELADKIVEKLKK